jgi:hypothetical protein
VFYGIDCSYEQLVVDDSCPPRFALLNVEPVVHISLVHLNIPYGDAVLGTVQMTICDQSRNGIHEIVGRHHQVYRVSMSLTEPFAVLDAQIVMPGTEFDTPMAVVHSWNILLDQW